eukprot:scaffold49846_cov61-Phaeocystis_antarctica.AAC.3
MGLHAHLVAAEQLALELDRHHALAHGAAGAHHRAGVALARQAMLLTAEVLRVLLGHDQRAVAGPRDAPLDGEADEALALQHPPVRMHLVLLGAAPISHVQVHDSSAKGDALRLSSLERQLPLEPAHTQRLVEKHVHVLRSVLGPAADHNGRPVVDGSACDRPTDPLLQFLYSLFQASGRALKRGRRPHRSHGEREHGQQQTEPRHRGVGGARTSSTTKLGKFELGNFRDAYDNQTTQVLRWT